jgi:hypothetical protein
MHSSAYRLRCRARGSCTSVWRCQTTVSVLGISKRIDNMPGDVNLKGSGAGNRREGGSLKDKRRYIATQVGKCRMDVEGEVVIQRTGDQLYGEMLRGGLMEGKEDSKVGTRLLWMVVSTKERGVRRMRIAHWQRALNGRATLFPTKSPCFIPRFHSSQ